MMKIPKHVAIILDGNGRWAKSKGMPRNYGHTVGAKNVETVCQAADELGIEYLTLYAFSTENWNRPDSEVAALMKLLESYLKNCIRTANKNNMRVRVIGELSRLSVPLYFYASGHGICNDPQMERNQTLAYHHSSACRTDTDGSLRILRG